uniref:Uncharacterized protein n=1 Tax=Ascaris lumbricoides TaxID=6252 RepID=A0A0M3I985_ASCLU
MRGRAGQWSYYCVPSRLSPFYTNTITCSPLIPMDSRNLLDRKWTKVADPQGDLKDSTSNHQGS